MTLAEFNRLPRAEAEALLRACCGASSWVRTIAAGRPYDGLDRLLDTADAVWRESGPADWDEAFAHHPRIGERAAAAEVSETARRWSAREQGGIGAAGQSVQDELARGNRAYEERFGRIYLVSAAGKSPEALLADLRARLGNAPADELRIAAEEQRKITQLRLRRLFAGGEENTP